jgi:arylsulfatase A-like enzyme
LGVLATDLVVYDKQGEQEMAERPNILILWGDDIGWWNISYNSRGQMGYRTPRRRQPRSYARSPPTSECRACAAARKFDRAR